MIGPDTVLRRCSDVRYRHVPPETVLVRQAGPEVMVLNDVAGRILDLVDGKATVGDLVAAVVREYDAPPDAVERDVLGFAEELLAAQVVAVVAGGGGER